MQYSRLCFCSQLVVGKNNGTLATEVDDRFVFERVRNHEITLESLLSLSFCPWFPFLSISSSVFLPSLFHSSTFICSFHRLYFFFVYLLCYKHHDILTLPCHFPLMLSLSLSQSFSLVLYLSFYSSVCPALSRAISVQRRQANDDLSDCGAVLPLFLLCSSLH